jgi:hypothetical protein
LCRPVHTLSAVRDQAFACSMRGTKTANVGSIKTLGFMRLSGTSNPLPVGPMNNTMLTLNIKRFLLTKSKRPTMKYHRKYFLNFRLQTKFALEEIVLTRNMSQVGDKFRRTKFSWPSYNNPSS